MALHSCALPPRLQRVGSPPSPAICDGAAATGPAASVRRGRRAKQLVPRADCGGSQGLGRQPVGRDRAKHRGEPASGADYFKMKKKKNVSLFTLWEKASKANKTASTSTPNGPNPPSVQADNNPHDVEVETMESNLQLALVQTDEDGHTHAEEERGYPSPIVEDESTDEEVEFEADLEALEHDPGKRIPISRYDPNDQDRVRRIYIELGPCQPKNHDFKFRDISGYRRRFCPTWFKQYKWLQYSVDKDAAFCFVCYLFKDKTKCPGVDAFVEEGFRNWNLKLRLTRHVGAITSAHAEAQEKYDVFTTPKASIRESVASNTTLYKTLYKRCLTWSLECLRFLLRQGLAFRGHDESEDSLNKENFLELLNWLAGNFEEVNMVVLKNAPQNCKMTSNTS